MSPASRPPGPGGWWRGLGAVLAVAALVWVAKPVVEQAGELARSPAPRALVAGVPAAAAAYAMLLAVAGAGWWWLCGAWGPRPAAFPAVAVWGRTQLAKYLPGNLFHFVGRQSLGRRLGLSHAAMAAASVLETLSFLLVASLLGTVGAALAGAGLEAARALPLLLLGLAALAFALPLLDRLCRRLPLVRRVLEEVPPLGPERSWRLLAPAMALHAVFLAGTGLALWALAAWAWPEAGLGAWRAVWGFALAWVAGTVTLGAPGGLGVREAVLVLLLGPVLGAAEAGALGLALRLGTVGGEVLLLAAGWAVRLPEG